MVLPQNNNMTSGDKYKVNKLTSVLLISAMLATLLAVTPASANYGSTDRSDCGYSNNNSGWRTRTGCVSLANNRWHVVRPVALGTWTGLDGHLDWVLANVYTRANTDINAYERANDSRPDVIVYDHNYGDNGVFGWVDCPANNSGRGGSGNLQWCRGQILRINASERPDYFRFRNRGGTRGLLCHELGHTMGLRHLNNSNSCMRRTVWGTRPPALSDHDINHLEDWY